VLHAKSTRTSSAAEAHDAGQSPVSSTETVAKAEGTVDPASGGAVARATSVTAPMVINGVLSLGEVRSSAEARVAAGGSLQRTSSLELGRTTVAGQVVTITPQGVQAANQSVPAPELPDVSDVLARAGVELTYLQARRTSTGVLSAGLAIRAQSQDASGAVTTVTYVLGRAFAGASPVGPSPGAVTGSVPGASVSDGTGFASGEALRPPVAAQLGAVPGAAVPEPLVEGPTTGHAGPALAGARIDLGLARFYLALVVAGLVMLVAGTLVRLLGVRTRWIS
jgi:hypothetical protein